MLAVLIYGQFRSYPLHLHNNLIELFEEVTVPLHFYFLTEDSNNYEVKKQDVLNIIFEFARTYNKTIEIKYFENMNSTTFYNANIENTIINDYNQIQTPYAKDAFTPKLIYRRCLINNIMNTFMIEYDKVMLVRLFDVNYKRCKSLDTINNILDTILYFGVDTIFFGKHEDMNILLNIDLISNKLALQKNDMNEFRQFTSKFDNFLANMMPLCASEIIFSRIIFNNFPNRNRNLRFDFTPDFIMKLIDVHVVNEVDKQDSKAYVNTILALNLNANDYLIIFLCPKRKDAIYL